MKELAILLAASLLAIGWLHGMYRHWQLLKELKSNKLPASRILGGFGARRDVKAAYDAAKAMDVGENRDRLMSAAKWVDITPITILFALVLAFIIGILTQG